MSVHSPLSQDATLRTVLPTLDKGVEFVASAFGRMNVYERQHGSVVLCLGVSRYSKGKRPNYRINDAPSGALVAVIDGNTHQPWTGEDINLSGDWSSATMTYAQVSEFLRELRVLERQKTRTR